MSSLVFTRSRYGLSSLAQVFKELQIKIEADVITANAIRKLTGNDQFQTKPLNHSGFVVYCVQRSENVRFFLEADHIEIQNDLTHEKCNLTITLNEEGRCKLVSNGAELEHWQVRRNALDRLFFGS